MWPSGVAPGGVFGPIPRGVVGRGLAPTNRAAREMARGRYRALAPGNLSNILPKRAGSGEAWQAAIGAPIHDLLYRIGNSIGRAGLRIHPPAVRLGREVFDALDDWPQITNRRACPQITAHCAR